MENTPVAKGKFVPINRHPSGHWTVHAAILNTGYPDCIGGPFPFIVDTASKRTLIVPDIVDEFPDHIKPLAIGAPKTVTFQTMVGPHECQAYSGFSLQFRCVRGLAVAVDPDATELCFIAEDAPLAAALRAGQSPEFPDGFAFNILGQDVLSQSTVIIPPRARHAFLVFDYDIMPKLRDLKAVDAYLDGLSEGAQVKPAPASGIPEEAIKVWESARSTYRPD